MRNLVHGLAHADGSGEVIDHVNAANRVAETLQVADVAGNELRVTCQIGWNSGRVNLLAQVIEDSDTMAFLQQSVRCMGPYKSGPAGYEDFLPGHESWLPLIWFSP